MVQRWKEGAALRWLNRASVQHFIALFVALAICRSASRVSVCKRRAHTSRQVLLLVMRMNENRNSQQRKSLTQESLSRFQALHLHTASTHCTRPQNTRHQLASCSRHSSRPCVSHPLSRLVFIMAWPPSLFLSFSYVFCIGVSWHRGSSGLYPRAGARTQSLE